MPVQFDKDLNELKRKLLDMGALAEQMIRNIVSVIVDRETSLVEKVSASEEQMDLFQNEVDEETVRLIAIHTPVAGDLRLLLVVARINAGLERIGDQVMNIAFYAKTLLKQESLAQIADIPSLANMAEGMVGGALDAFTKRSGRLALSVIKADNRMDQLHDQVFRKLMAQATSDAAAVTGVLELILIARAFERIADHAVSIAEDVIYMVEARNIRHVHDDINGSLGEDANDQDQTPADRQEI